MSPNTTAPTAEAPQVEETNVHNDALSPAALAAWAEKMHARLTESLRLSGADEAHVTIAVGHLTLARFRALAALAQAAPRVGGEGGEGTLSEEHREDRIAFATALLALGDAYPDPRVNPKQVDVREVARRPTSNFDATARHLTYDEAEAVIARWRASRPSR